jgi:hypothetical protein
MLRKLPEQGGISVMPALVAGIHVFLANAKTWMAGTSPAMTKEEKRCLVAILLKSVK